MKKTNLGIRLPLRSIGLLAVPLLLLGGWGAVLASPQSDPITWSKPVNLSDTQQSSTHPAIVADGYGYFHVFWSEDVGGVVMQAEDNTVNGNSILYTRWDGVSWCPPVDILFVPGENIAEFVAADVDAKNRLHVVWTGQADFYYSNAPSWQASSAHAWSKPVVVATDSARSQWESDIVADAFGNVHIVYATRGDEAGVYHIRSQDGGATWGAATKLSEPFDRLETSFSNVKVITDGAGRLHAVWQTNQEQGYGQAIYYARSTDQGQSWSPPVQLGYRDPGDYEASWPYLAAIGESQLHLIYVDGPGSIGRFHRISEDGGETWSEPHHIIAEMEGVNGYVIPLVDGSGQMHLIINMRTRSGQVVGIYYARWLGTGWSPLAPLATEAPYAPSAHYTAATVRLGNELHIAWNQIRRGEIWHMTGIMPEAVPVPALLLPLPETSTPSLPTATREVTPTPTPTSQPVKQFVAPAAAASSSPITSNPFVLSIGVPFLLVLGTVIWVRTRAKRR